MATTKRRHSTIIRRNATATSSTVDPVNQCYTSIRTQLDKRIVGQEHVINELITAFFAGGHCLLMGVPGLAKTLLIRSFSEAMGMKFNRIQFTPDLMPSDITGTDVISNAGGERNFEFLTGPIFANIVLADEINRTPPKTQASMLEAMEERHVTVSGHQYDLPDPFFVMATQNPIEQEGTYPLPIAALDRFLFKVHVDYPDSEEELNMLLATTSRGEQEVQPVVTKEQVVTMLRTVREIHIAEDTMEYAVRLVRATRPTQSDDSYIKEMVETGGSPRAVQALILGGKAHAALDGRDEAMPKDLRSIIHPALRHRVVPSFHANADGINSDQLIDYVVEHTARPRNDKTETVVEKRPFNLMRWLLGEPKPRKRAISLQPNV